MVFASLCHQLALPWPLAPDKEVMPEQCLIVPKIVKISAAAAKWS